MPWCWPYPDYRTSSFQYNISLKGGMVFNANSLFVFNCREESEAGLAKPVRRLVLKWVL